MNAQELFDKYGNSANLFSCEKCHAFSRSKKISDECCTLKSCKSCGKEVGEKYWEICMECRTNEEIEREKKRFDDAKKVPESEWDSWIYWGGIGCNNGYFVSIEELNEYIQDDRPPDEELELLTDEEKAEILTLPDYVWACEGKAFVRIDADRLWDTMTEFNDAYEDFDEDSIKGWDELKITIDKFNSINSDIISYQYSYKTAIIVDKTTHES